MTPASLFQPKSIQDIATTAYDSMASALHAQGSSDDTYQAARAHAFGRLAHRAALIEAVDPPIRQAPNCSHIACAAYRNASSDRKPVPKEERL